MAGLDAQPPRVRLPWQAGVMGDGPVANEVRNQHAGVQGIGQEAFTTVTQTGGAVDQVEHMPAAAAASPSLAGQLGPRAPSGIPLQPPIHTAPAGPGARFRGNAPQPAGLAVALHGAGGRY